MSHQKKHNIPELSAQKKRIFFGVVILLPFVLFIGIEFLLRWVNYGPDLSLFKQYEIRGQNYYLMNPEVKSRYFADLNFAPTTSADYFLVSKPTDTYRIFCLGGSTTVGYPYWYNGSFSSYLRDRLKATFPDKKIEVVNLGMTATNSFTVLDMARELVAFQPDLILVYDGHNEFYGALGVASQQTVGSSRFAALLYLRLVHSRTFLLLRDVLQKSLGLLSSNDRAPSRRTMMETLARDRYVPHGNELYKSAFSAFKSNLEDLRTICREHEIHLILGTQASSLRNQRPFISNISDRLTQAQRDDFTRLYENGKNLHAQRKFDLAKDALETAIRIDSTHADAHFILAQSLDALGKKKEALQEFILARDYDELRFRTDTQFNNLIRSMQDDILCFVADVEETLKGYSQDSLIGNNLITEHLHPNSRGYFLIAQTYAQVMKERGLFATHAQWTGSKSPDESLLWENRAVTELDERIAARRTEVLTSSWPFTDQAPIVNAIPRTDTLGQIAEQTTEGSIDWKEAHLRAVAFYERRREWRNVEREYRAIVNQIPLDLGPYMELARLYYQLRRFDDMATVLRTTLRVEPTIQAYRTLGDITLQKGDPVGAVTLYERMDGFVQSPEERLQNGYMLCVAYMRAKEPGKAKTRLLELLKLKPDFQPAIELLIEASKQIESRPKE